LVVLCSETERERDRPRKRTKRKISVCDGLLKDDIKLVGLVELEIHPRKKKPNEDF
jgi:hypothetical protein